MPMSLSFAERLQPALPQIVEAFGTPFHVYDEAGMVEGGRRLNQLFAAVPGFREYYAVKALPNLRILEILRRELGFGFDCSSIPELQMARSLGAGPDDIMFSSNNTSPAEYAEALGNGGCILNLDDITFIDKVPLMPELICFRYNPGNRRTGNAIIGKPEEAKYGLRHDQIIDAYRLALERGASRFGLHTMVVSNERNYEYMVATIEMLFGICKEVTEATGIRFEFINIGGGIGIPYRPEQEPFDLAGLAEKAAILFEAFWRETGYTPRLLMECGRAITGPHGVLVTRVLNVMSKYRDYVGVDACMSSLMRPAMYDAYHHITAVGRDGREKRGVSGVVDVVGSLCENNDKFAQQRELPAVEDGDYLLIQDTGAHGLAMGFQYNGRLRPKELLFHRDGSIELIRRAETLDDYLRTQTNFEPRTLKLGEG
ncbi:MAG: diaminopimelate decarboxylase [Dehalococcoidia bacterium]|nr:diaminopimelate decarboxylase [Dehalococcoidia bacterium]